MPAPIYLDNAATTALDPAVAELMSSCLSHGPKGNASSGHAGGRAARALIEAARAQVAARLRVSPEELVFTSGATESNNLALRGVLAASRQEHPQLITSCIEHPSVLATAKALERQGVEVILLGCDAEGVIDVDALRRTISKRTALVSVMHVNNELGVVSPLAAIGAICREHEVPLHVDAAQSIGKLEFDAQALGVDLCSLSAHKLHGPQGIGALFVRAGLGVEPLLFGGGQERSLRPGTLPTHQIVGMGLAYELADPSREGPRLERLRRLLWQGLQGLEGVRLNGAEALLAPHILNVSFARVEGESLRLALSDLMVSRGSACTSAAELPSHVLSALGLSDALAESSLRFSLGRYTSATDIERAVARISAELPRLRQLTALAPAWCSS